MTFLNIAALCLALNVYHEARGEPIIGQLAVIQVVQNRVKDPRFPNDICGVVTQPGQFSWVGDHIPDEPKDQKEWVQSVLLTVVYMDNELIDITDEAIFYHALPWNRKGKTIGNHIFWK